MVFRQVRNDVGHEQKLKKFSRKEKTLGVRGSEDRAATGDHLRNIRGRKGGLTVVWEIRTLNHQQLVDATGCESWVQIRKSPGRSEVPVRGGV